MNHGLSNSVELPAATADRSASATGRRLVSATRLVVALCAVVACDASAQTDYYNTDAGHPLAIEDAYAIERFALELRPFSPSFSRHSGGVYAIELESEASYGVLPRTQVDAKLSWRRAERGTTYQSGLSGIALGVLHNLNVETRVPALAVSAELLLPVGAMAPEKAHATVTAIATRSFTLARVHVNAGYTFGRSPRRIVLAHGVQTEVPRWRAGVAIDRTLALRSLLLSAELVAERPTLPLHPAIAEMAGGLRRQYGPRVVIDGGVARHLTGDDRALIVRAGGLCARAAAVRARRWRAVGR